MALKETKNCPTQSPRAFLEETSQKGRGLAKEGGRREEDGLLGGSGGEDGEAVGRGKGREAAIKEEIGEEEGGEAVRDAKGEVGR